uniref:Reverse transcriptase Ty1/copia-type domain-containing protein n=1 Tax=Daphnia galeata TaxID=27404 RepID=A0A8J2RKG8_9CRUS|nr:unnamed protein product [Daphnia galeata]
MPPKRKLKVVVGKRQRARRVREFVDRHFNIHSENDREAVEVNVPENSYVESEEAVYEETSSDSELETSSFDFDNVTAEEDGSLGEPPVADIYESEEVNYFGCLGANEVDDNDSDVDEADDWEVASEVDSELSEIEFQKLFKRRLCHWAVASNVPRESVNKLLRVLKTDPNYSFLPLTYKTLLGTPRKDAIVASLNSVNAKFPFDQTFELGLLVGCDGTSVGRSTNRQFWPVIGKLCLDGTEPFDIGFYQEGEYVQNISSKGGRVTYPEIDAAIRTDESFRDREQIKHHAGFSILESLPIDMVETFPIYPMHLVYMGAAQMMKKISDILVKIEKLISVEFERKTRTLDELSRFKATEFRLLLLYILPIILKNRLPDEVYQHFLLLHVAIRIFSCKESVKDEANVDYANSLLVLFIKKSVPIYGDQFLTYNIHNLQHLGEECKRLGSVEMFSCFAFENHIGKLKNLVRKSAKPLQQLVNRTIEIRYMGPRARKMTTNRDVTFEEQSTMELSESRTGTEENYYYSIIPTAEDHIQIGTGANPIDRDEVAPRAEQPVHEKKEAARPIDQTQENAATPKVYGKQELTYRQALSSPDVHMWDEAIKDEYSSLIKKVTWELAPLPPNRSAMKCKWAFEIKQGY